MIVSVRRLIGEYYRYALVGAVVTSIDFCIMIFMVEILKTYYLYAAANSFLVANIVQYFLCAKFVFTKNKHNLCIRSFIIFFLLGLIGLGILAVSMYLLVDILKMHYITAKVIASILIFTFNFTTKRFIVFK